MLRALVQGGASEATQVAWGDLVPGRSAADCQRRWHLMLERVEARPPPPPPRTLSAFRAARG